MVVPLALFLTVLAFFTLNLGAFVTALLRGALVTRKQHDALVDLYRLRADDSSRLADKWESAYKLESASNGMMVKQYDQLLDAANTTIKVIEAIPKAILGGGDSNDKP